MQTTIDFLDAVKARHSVQSDYQLAKTLGITRSAISELRNQKAYLGDQTALKVAELLDLSPGIVLSAVHAERAKAPAEKAAWESIFEKLGGMAAAVLLAFCLLPGSAWNASAATPAAGSTGPHTIYIQYLRRRYNFRHMAIF